LERGEQEDLARMPGLILKGADLTPRRQDFDPIEIASRDEISALQLERLKRTLTHVYGKVAHYKQAFDKAGVHPDDLKTLDDLRKFPFTAKGDLRDNYPFGLMAMPRDQLLRLLRHDG
jgi:phenylacetate-CoA ligase